MRFWFWISIGGNVCSGSTSDTDGNRELQGEQPVVVASDPLKCSLAFAQIVAIAADLRVKTHPRRNQPGKDEILAAKLQATKGDVDTAYHAINEGMFAHFSKPSVEDNVSCFPLIDHVGEIRGLTHDAARLIAAAIRWVGIGSLPDIVAVESLRLDNMLQFIVSIPAELPQGDHIFTDAGGDQLGVVGCSADIWSQEKFADPFRNSVPTMNENKEGNYFLSFFKLFKEIDACCAEKLKHFDDRSTHDIHGSISVTMGGDSHTRLSSDSSSRDPLRPTVAEETFKLTSMMNEEKLFFTNFHNAAQQLSLLGIKAVGLATMIQAIRGHLMMVQLIDQHIDTLEKDKKKYTGLLTNAHEQLERVTGVGMVVGETEPRGGLVEKSVHTDEGGVSVVPGIRDGVSGAGGNPAIDLDAIV